MKLIRRFLVLILTFILFFSISAPYYIFASDITASTSSDPAGWDSWSLNEKQDYLQHFAWNIVCSVTGLVHGDSEAMKNIILDLYASRPESGVTNFYEYLANGLSFDDDTRTWELSDDLVDFFNALIVDYNDRVTMTYRYFFNPDNVDFSVIDHKDVYNELIRVMKEYPNLHFVITGRVSNERGQGPAFWIMMNEDLEYAVSLNNDLGIVTKNKLFTSNWENPVPHVKICIFDQSRDDGLYWGYQIPSQPDVTQYYASFDDIYKMYKNGEIASSTYSADYLYELPLAPSKTTKLNLTSWRCPISADPSAINCYKSVADMKNDSGNQFIGRYTDTYTGTTINNVSQDTINNIVNNYYPKDPDVDPDDPASGSSSIKKILNDILDEIKESNKHLEKIIKQLRLNNFLTGVDTILDALDLFYDVLNGELSDLASNIFSDNADQFNAVSGQLSKKFPFCLPYDLQAILYILVAEPVDPVFDIPFKAGSSFSSSGYLIDENIHLDFTDFSQSVSVLHFFIKLYWIVALLLLTPKVIHRNGGA